MGVYPLSLRIRVGGVQRGRGAEKTNCTVDGDHLVIMREVDVEGPVEGEGGRRAVQRVVHLCRVLDCSIRETSKELVDVTNALDRPQRIPVAIVYQNLL